MKPEIREQRRERWAARRAALQQVVRQGYAGSVRCECGALCSGSEALQRHRAWRHGDKVGGSHAQNG